MLWSGRRVALAANSVWSRSVTFAPPRGTRDFFPEQLLVQRWLFGEWRRAANLHGFKEYDAPVVETEDLYIRKAGEEVTGQLYSFDDKGGRRLALRPEMTPSLARMVMSKQGSLPLPLKWFSIPQCWRYERMTRGRRREHYQWNMDVWGVPATGLDRPGSVAAGAELELLAAQVTLFKRVGLTSDDVAIRISSRALLNEVFQALGVENHAVVDADKGTESDTFTAMCMVIDKLDKQPREAVQADLENLDIPEKTCSNLLDFLAHRDLPSIQRALDDLKDATASPSASDALAELGALLDGADGYGIGQWLEIDTSIVRGLSYYTGVVFETRDRSGEFRAIAGGGRYDHLLSSLFSTSASKMDIPAVGFGFGDAVLLEILQSRELIPDQRTLRLLTGATTDIVLFALDATLRTEALKLAGTLRECGHSVDLVVEEKRAKWVFKHANRCDASHVVVLAPDEWRDGKVAVKSMRAGEQGQPQDGNQTTVPVEELADWFSSQ